METFYAAAAQAGATGVHVTVTTANTRALGFYHRLGFRPLEIAPVEIAPVEITEPGETMVTYLGRGL
jgi:ribosomal protein S18 acetylase RimI-like enzyme